jgi:predicted permease
VVQQLLTECFVLAGIAAAIGLVLAQAIIRGLIAISPPNLPRVDDIRIDLPVLLFAVGLTVVSTVIFGLIPALQTSRLDLAEALKQGGSKGSASGSGGRLRSILVTAEIALSVVLLASAGLLLRSFQKLQQVDLGFTTERVLVAYTQFVVANEDDRRRRRAFYQDLMTRVRALPGFLPLGKELRPPVAYVVQGRPASSPGDLPTTEYQVATPDYFKTLGIPLREGRDFNDGDVIDSPRVALINETLARTAFPGESPIGRLLHLNPGNKNPRNKPMEIIGVVAATRWRDPSKSPPAEIFIPALQGGSSLSILARTSMDEETLAIAFRKLMREVDPSVPIRVETMEQLFSDALTFPRFRTQLIGAFASIALLLSAVGIFSVLAYLVGQRTREFAVRMALGAGGADVVRLVFSHGLRLIALGLALGLAGSLAIARLLDKLLYQVTPWDLVAYLGAIAALGITALIAILLPALRAAAVDPLIALRSE